MLFSAKVTFANAIGHMSRLLGRGGGTTLPGKVLLALDRNAISKLAGRLDEGSVVISATNGKTTTAAMVAAVLEQNDRPFVHNFAGANMAGGVAAALARVAFKRGQRWQPEGQTSDRSDLPRNGTVGTLGLFEIDEFWVNAVVDQLKPRAVLLANLFRDQLDRFGELETIADRWAEVVKANSTVFVLNADDPLVADLGRGSAKTVFFGLGDDKLVRDGLQHASDSKHCRRCGSPYVYDAIYLAHLGRYHCPNCGVHRPNPTVTATNIELNGMRSVNFDLNIENKSVPIQLALPGLYNVYNAVAAAALCHTLGFTITQIQTGLNAVAPAFGRAEVVQLNGRRAVTLLIKNPAGANEVLRTLTARDSELDLFGILNDRIADGRDVSWIWDADWEQLEGRVRTFTCAGTRADELALRLKYAGVPTKLIKVENELVAGLNTALSRSADNDLYIMPTYTAMLELRRELIKRGSAREYWDA